MSNEAQHNLQWETEYPTRDEMTKAIAVQYYDTPPEIEDHMVAHVDELTGGIESFQWNDCDRHIARASTQWPQVVFTLHGEAHDGYRWVTFFKNGMHYTEEPALPSFNQEKFERLGSVYIQK